MRECPRCSFLNPVKAEHCIKCRFLMSRVYKDQPVNLIDKNPVGAAAAHAPDAAAPETVEPVKLGEHLDTGPGLPGGLEELDGRNRSVELEDRSYYEIGGYRIGGVPGGHGYSGPPPSDVFAVRDGEAASGRKSRRGRKKTVKDRSVGAKPRPGKSSKASKDASVKSRPLKVKKPAAEGDTRASARPQPAAPKAGIAPPTALKAPPPAPVVERTSKSPPPPPVKTEAAPRPALNLKANKAPSVKRAAPARAPLTEAPPEPPPKREVAPEKPVTPAPAGPATAAHRPTKAPVTAASSPPRKKRKPARKSMKGSSRKGADELTPEQFPQIIPGSGTPLGTVEEPHEE